MLTFINSLSSVPSLVIPSRLTSSCPAKQAKLQFLKILTLISSQQRSGGRGGGGGGGEELPCLLNRKRADNFEE